MAKTGLLETFRSAPRHWKTPSSFERKGGESPLVMKMMHVCGDGYIKCILIDGVKTFDVKCRFFWYWDDDDDFWEKTCFRVYAVGVHIQEIFYKGLHGAQGVLHVGDWKTGRRFSDKDFDDDNIKYPNWHWLNERRFFSKDFVVMRRKAGCNCHFKWWQLTAIEKTNK